MLEAHAPDMRYSVAVLASGSDVLGFDTEMSMDHDWGPRVMLFLKQEDFETRPQAIRALAMKHLPLTYRGYPVHIYTRDVRDAGVRMRQRPNDPGLEPRIEIYTIHDFFQKQLGVDPDKPLSAADWLTMTHHRLRSMINGRVFRDDVGIQAMRDRFCWYPHDVWLYVLASCWASDQRRRNPDGEGGKRRRQSGIGGHRMAPYPRYDTSGFPDGALLSAVPEMARLGIRAVTVRPRTPPAAGARRSCL